MRWPRITISTPMLAPPVRIQTRLKRQIRTAMLRDDRRRMILEQLRRHLLRRLPRIILQAQRRKPLIRIKPRPTPPNTRRPFRWSKPERRASFRLRRSTSLHEGAYVSPQALATTCSQEHILNNGWASAPPASEPATAEVRPQRESPLPAPGKSVPQIAFGERPGEGWPVHNRRPCPQCALPSSLTPPLPPCPQAPRPDCCAGP